MNPGPQMDEDSRFVDHGLTVADFVDEILVVCPRCGSCASVIPQPGGEQDLLAPRRLVCFSCGLVRDTGPCSVLLGNDSDPVDSYFHLPLWLVARHGVEKILWAYNLRHLLYLEAFVRATVRTRRSDVAGHANRSVISRLPRWIKKAGNRDQVLAMIESLRRSAGG